MTNVDLIAEGIDINELQDEMELCEIMACEELAMSVEDTLDVLKQLSR